MLKIKVNENLEFELSDQNDEIYVNGEYFSGNINTISKDCFQIIYNNKSHLITILERSAQEMRIEVDGNIYSTKTESKYDRYLKKLGISSNATTGPLQITAPMPGKVVEVKVNDKQEVTKGDSLLILEAMKMENIIKAPRDGIVTQILVKPGTNVEKGETLIKF